MFKEVNDGIFVGEFEDVPSRSGSAEVTLVLKRTDEKNQEAYLSYASHESCDARLGTRESIVEELREWSVQDNDPEWKAGLIVLLNAVENIINTWY